MLQRRTCVHSAVDDDDVGSSSGGRLRKFRDLVSFRTKYTFIPSNGRRHESLSSPKKESVFLPRLMGAVFLDMVEGNVVVCSSLWNLVVGSG